MYLSIEGESPSPQFTTPYPHVWLDISALKAFDAGRDAQRTQQFDDMIAFNRTRGWIDDTGALVQAHLTNGED